MSEPDIVAPRSPSVLPAEPGKVQALVQPAETWRRTGRLAPVVSALAQAAGGSAP